MNIIHRWFSYWILASEQIIIENLGSSNKYFKKIPKWINNELNQMKSGMNFIFLFTYYKKQCRIIKY